jgi:hypothetical protein
MEMLVGWITHGNQDDIDAVGKLFGLGSHAEGGFTANVPRNQVAGIVHGQEWVATADQTQKYKPLFAAISAGKPLPFVTQASSALTVSTQEDEAGSTQSAGGAVAGNASASAQTIVNIHNSTGQPVQQKQTKMPGGGQQLDVYIGKLAEAKVLQNIASGGSIDKQMQGQYGLSRSGTRRG